MRKLTLQPISKWCLATCSVGLIVGDAWGQHAFFPNRNCAPPSPYQTSRESVYQPLARQAANGAILDSTVWNHHFEEGAPILHSSGYHFLDRIARRSYGHVLQIHMQTTRDVAYEPRFEDKFDAYRQSLDAARAKAVAGYMRAAYPSIAFQIHVIEPSPVGMAGIEAGKAVSEIRDTAKGILPPDLLKSIGSYLPSGAGSGGGDFPPPPPPTPVTAGTGLGGSFGTEPPIAAPGPGSAAPPPGLPPAFPSDPVPVP